MCRIRALKRVITDGVEHAEMGAGRVLGGGGVGSCADVGMLAQ